MSEQTSFGDPSSITNTRKYNIISLLDSVLMCADNPKSLKRRLMSLVCTIRHFANEEQGEVLDEFLKTKEEPTNEIIRKTLQISSIIIDNSVIGGVWFPTMPPLLSFASSSVLGFYFTQYFLQLRVDDLYGMYEWCRRIVLILGASEARPREDLHSLTIEIDDFVLGCEATPAKGNKEGKKKKKGYREMLERLKTVRTRANVERSSLEYQEALTEIRGIIGTMFFIMKEIGVDLFSSYVPSTDGVMTFGK